MILQQICEPGFACPDTTFSNRIDCRLGHYSGLGSTRCHLCEPGFYCAGTREEERVRCDPFSTYAHFGGRITECPVCPAGSSCNVSSLAVSTCEKGDFSEEGSMDCKVIIVKFHLYFSWYFLYFLCVQ